MPFPPMARGHGGSQRAWYLVNALAAIAPVHLVLLFPTTFREAADVDLSAVEPLVASIVRIGLPEWSPSWHAVRRMPKRVGRWLDLVRMGSGHVPRLGNRVLRRIARELPTATPDLIFAARLPLAVIAQQLMDRDLLSTPVKVVDFDDVQSRFQQREMQAEPRRFSALDKIVMDRLLLTRTQRAEFWIATTWDAISVCSDEDVEVVAAENPGARVCKVPNVIDKPQLPYQDAVEKPFTVLFVANLAFGPNAHGLEVFADQAWPVVRRELPGVRLQIVGLNPPSAVQALIEAAGMELHANVPSVEPYYASADAVIAPILFGGGTRIKILEAMAFGRAVVSTTIGAEGLNAVNEEHLLIADDMKAFGAAIVRLARDRRLQAKLMANARALQQHRFGRPAIDAAVRSMLSLAGFDDAKRP